MAKTKRQRLEEKLAEWSPEEERLANIDPEYFAWHHQRRPAHSPLSSSPLDSLEGDKLTEMLKADVNPILFFLTLPFIALGVASVSVVVFIIRAAANLILYFADFLPDNIVFNAIVGFLIWLTEGGE